MFSPRVEVDRVVCAVKYACSLQWNLISIIFSSPLRLWLIQIEATTLDEMLFCFCLNIVLLDFSRCFSFYILLTLPHFFSPKKKSALWFAAKLLSAAAS
jgi:hypothetical protein